MRTRMILMLIGLSLWIGGCNFSTSTAQQEGQDVSESVAPPIAGTQSCLSPLVALQTGPDSSCAGGNIHLWPVAYGVEDCHGWSSVDTTGRLHENSANNIRCNPDGTFSFVQYAGTLTCSGGQAGVTKSYIPNTCLQDIPPTLFTKAIDLTCCSTPDSPNCRAGLPSVSVQASASEIFFNGQVCKE